MQIVSLFPLLRVEDLSVSSAFYEQLGFMPVHLDQDYLHMVWQEKQDVQLGFLRDSEKLADAAAMSAGSLAIEVHDVEAVYALIRDRGLEISEELVLEEWGHHRFSISDPDGNRIEFFSHQL